MDQKSYVDKVHVAQTSFLVLNGQLRKHASRFFKQPQPKTDFDDERGATLWSLVKVHPLLPRTTFKMDRNSFLSCLPFLIPTSLESLPLTSVEESDHQHILTDHLVSIEPLSTKKTNLGAAFFETKGVALNDSDPALSTCDLKLKLVEQRHGKSSPNLLSSPLISPPTSAMTASLYLNINSRLYKVDWSQMDRVSVHQAEADKPGCLLLHFPSCMFRIFTMESQEELMPKYKSLEGIMNQALSPDSTIAPALSFDSSTSTTPGNSYDTVRAEAKDSGNTSIGKSFHALRQAHKEMDSLATVLDMPLKSAKSKAYMAGEVYTLMATIADDLAASYRVTCDAPCQSSVQNLQKELDDTLNDFFPAPRSRQKRQVDHDKAIESVEKLIKRRRKIAEQRHGIFLLPTRG